MTTLRRSPGAWIVAGLFALLALLVVPVFPHFVSPNETTRWALAAAVVENGTLEVTGPARILGPRMEDVAEVDGRLYSNKAPGTALVALPGYLAARTFAGAPSPSSLRPSLTAMRLAGATLPVLLLAVVFLRLSPEAGRSEALFGLLFATPLFAYALLLFAHASVAACLFGAWAALFAPARASSDAVRELAAGALLGLAVLSEYPAAIPALVLVGVAAWGAPARLLRIVLGGLPFAALLAGHNAACFGSPFVLSSGLEKDPAFRELALYDEASKMLAPAVPLARSWSAARSRRWVSRRRSRRSASASAISTSASRGWVAALSCAWIPRAPSSARRPSSSRRTRSRRGPARRSCLRSSRGPASIRAGRSSRGASRPRPT